jgi:hypothetical protein
MLMLRVNCIYGLAHESNHFHFIFLSLIFQTTYWVFFSFFNLKRIMSRPQLMDLPMNVIISILSSSHWNSKLHIEYLVFFSILLYFIILFYFILFKKNYVKASIEGVSKCHDPSLDNTKQWKLVTNEVTHNMIQNSNAFFWDEWKICRPPKTPKCIFNLKVKIPIH